MEQQDVVPRSSEEKKLIVMRGLPWCGKSYRACELAGTTGLIYSTDEYFYKVVSPDKPDVYTFNPRVLHHAHAWNQNRAKAAVESGSPLIIIDNTNTIASEPKPYVEAALAKDYKICIEEPTSDRWLTIRELLRDKKKNKAALKEWAARLAEGSKETHNVPHFAIEKMMWRWECDLTIERILNPGG